MYSIVDLETGEIYSSCKTADEVIDWINNNCETFEDMDYYNSRLVGIMIN